MAPNPWKGLSWFALALIGSAILGALALGIGGAAYGADTTINLMTEFQVNLGDDDLMRQLYFLATGGEMNAEMNSSLQAIAYCANVDKLTDGKHSHPFGITPQGQGTCINDVKDEEFATRICSNFGMAAEEFNLEKQTVVCRRKPKV